MLVGLAFVAGLAAPAAAAPDFLALREKLEVARPRLRDRMAPYLRAQDAAAFPADKPGEAFRKYLDLALEVVAARRDFPAVHSAMAGFRGRLDATDAVQRQALGVFLGDYLQVRYGDDLQRELGKMVAYRTFNTVVDRNADNVELRACLDWLAKLAQALGFEVRHHEHQMLEIALVPAGAARTAAPVAVWAHADVARVIEHKWESKPFTLREHKGRWTALGVYDAKGPVLVNLFAMRALRDAGLQLARPVVLLVDAAGEQPEADVGAAVRRLATPPALVLAADGEFPFATGQAGRLMARLSSSYGMKTRAGIRPEEYFVYKIQAWPGSNSVPHEVRTWVRYEPPVRSDNPVLHMVNKWRAVIEGYQPDHAQCVYETYVQEDTLHYFVYGNPAHVLQPDRATNSILDVAGSLLRLPMYRNSARDVLTWIDKGYARDATGGTLGLAFAHPEMGATVVTPVAFDRLGDEVTVLVDVRWPPGHDAAWVRAQLAAHVRQFNKEHGTALELGWEPVAWEPVQQAPPREIQLALEDAYALASGEGAPAAAATAACARVLPAAIPFGPNRPRGDPRAHTRDESISERELQDLGVAYAAALAWFATGPLPATP